MASRDIQIIKRSPEIGRTIRQCRMALGMSKQLLSEKIGRDSAFISKLETAAIPISSEMLADCASAFGLSVSELIEISISAQVILTLEVSEDMLATS